MPRIRGIHPRSARELIERATDGPFVSVFVDLDPTRFATPAARASQFSSLENEARAAMGNLDSSDRTSAEESLETVLGYLRSDDFPPPGAEGVALFCGPPDVFEVFALRAPVDGQAAVAANPILEPVAGRLSLEPRWGVLLINRRTARILAGAADALRERVVVEDHVHGKHKQGGWSQARYERSVEEEARDHVARSIDELAREHRGTPFAHLVLATPGELITEITGRIPPPLRARIAGTIDADVELATVGDVQRLLEPIAAEEQARAESEALEALAERVGRGERAAVGEEAVRSALAERRVERLLFEAGWEVPEDITAAALEQRANVVIVHTPMEKARPVAALLRF